MTQRRTEGSPAPAGPRAKDSVSLAERMVYLQALRVGFVVVAFTSLLLTPELTKIALVDLATASAGYLLIVALVEALRRTWRIRAPELVTGMLLIDGLFLAWLVIETDGVQSPLRFLVYIHVIAVTLVASYRTGLKIALWHSLLYVVAYYAQRADIIPSFGGQPHGELFAESSAFYIVALWLIAVITAIFSSLNERELRRSRADLEALARLATEIEAVHTVAEVAELLAARLRESYPLSRVVVLGGDPGAMQLLAYAGSGDVSDTGGGIDDVVARAMAERKTLLVRRLDPDKDPRLSSMLPFARNLLVVPMFAEGRTSGALVAECDTRVGLRIERRVVTMVERSAAYAGLALRSAWLLGEVQHMAVTDPLTMLPNRRTFFTVLQKELSRARRNGEPLTLLMLDIDNFKDFNDEHGHPAGDKVLEQVGRQIAREARNFDTPTRYGGEEFAVILPACSARESVVVGDRLRRSIARIRFPASITASGGTATFPDHAADMENLIKAADDALYEAKSAGRDRLVRSRRGPHHARPQAPPPPDAEGPPGNAAVRAHTEA